MNVSIARALNSRFEELCTTYVPKLVPQNFGEMALLVCYIRKELTRENQKEWAVNFLTKGNTSDGWMENEGDFLAVITELVMGKVVPVHYTERKDPGRFMEVLNASHETSSLVNLLVTRYQCPLNILLPSEEEVREYILYRTMVPDRAKLDKGSLLALDHDDLLIRLNLIAVYAMATGDLRYLDSLNYYYERLPAHWIPEGKFPWLFVSYLGLYARTLAIWANEGQPCE